MPAGRRRKTTPVRVRLRRWGALTLPVLALAAVAVPVASALEPTGGDRAVGTTTADSLALPERAAARTVSRSFQRPETPPPHLTDVEGIAEAAVATNRDALAPRWATDDLVVWSEAGSGSRVELQIKDGDKVLVTGAVQGAWSQIAHGDQLAWVRRNGLTRDEPVATATDPSSGATLTFAGHVPAGVAGAPCPDGSSVESGLTTNAIKVYRAVCAAFPELSTYGGQDGHGEHVNGEAIDFMVPNSSVGQRLADFLYAHHAQLDLFDIIWSQHIWTIERSGEGFRSMSDRGSATANHYDHVHIKIN